MHYKLLGVPLQLDFTPYWFLAFLRVFLTLVPQYGYIHPDEFFQSVEVIAGDVFNVETSRPWEFNTTFPIRSVAIPYLVVGLPFKTLKALSPYLLYYFNFNVKTPYFLIIFPRLVSCALSFISDYCLYQICCSYGQNYRARLITLASSYVILTYGTRTFSNMLEMVLMSVLLYLVADCMFFSDKIIYHDDYLSDKYDKAKTPVEKVKYMKLRHTLPSHSLSKCLIVATLSVAGIFNRPTFIAFALPPVFFWLYRGLGSKNIGLGQFNVRIFTFMLCGIPATLFFILIDSIYYGYLTNSEIQELTVSINSFVVTPVNFVRYNLDTSNLANHGLHPRYLHFIVNIPLLYNVLGVIGLTKILQMVYKGVILRRWTELPRIQSIVGLMTASFVVPIIVLSVFPHQEARFLIPVTLPLIFLHSQRIRHIKDKVHKGRNIFSIKLMENFSGNHMLSLWYFFNIILTVFYGFLHQGGIFPLISHISQEIQYKPQLTSLHLVTSHMYSLPISLLQLHNSKVTVINRDTKKKYKVGRQVFTHELGSLPMEEVHRKIGELLYNCEERKQVQKLNYRLYLALPATLSEDFHATTLQNISKFSYSIDHIFYPHVSTEALPNLFAHTHCPEEDESIGFCDNEPFLNSPFKYFSKIIQQFGLILIRISK